VTDLDRLLPLLRCQRCAGRFERSGSANADGLRCLGCGYEVAVRNGVPRFVAARGDDLARRTEASFGYEWTQFHDWTASGTTNFNDYFQGVDLQRLRPQRVLDAGCGMGRHARQMGQHAAHVVAVDFSAAIDMAAMNVADAARVDCVQADLLALPFADASFDYVYSLGVLHHLSDTAGALRQLAAKTRPGGRVRIYLYWRRHGIGGWILRAVNVARRLTVRLPFPILKVLCWWLAAALWLGVVLPYRMLARLGVERHRQWPLFVYAKYPFTVLYNDQFDRFSAPLEKRFDAHEVRRLMEGAGLRDVQIIPNSGWIGEGSVPAEPAA
jgi:SAM-dependent methyltransferase